MTQAQLIAFLVSNGPMVVGMSLLLATTKRLAGFCHPLYPFHKNSASFALHMSIGYLMSVLPVYYTITMLLSQPGQSLYHQLWGTHA